MEYSDARFMQQSVGPIYGSAHAKLYCCRYYLNIYSHIYVQCIKQTRDMPTTKCKIEFFKVLQSLCSAKSKTNLIYLYIHLVETFNSSFKNCFQEAFFQALLLPQ